ncbi:MAG: glycosyltransferase family 1 protein [Magnetococcales bacterium]|nr:glycosyltransferase family 1 protein [Magnetococcales bacterium]
MKVALFTQKPSQPYMKIYFGLRQALEEAGVEVEGFPLLLSDQALAAFCQEMQPDVVFEMDRTRRQVPSLPKHIPHVCWIVDYASPYCINPFCDRFDGSDIVYFLSKDWFTGQSPSLYGAKKLAWLPPGFAPQQYYFEERPYQCDFSFVGHMPNVWSEKEKSRLVGEREGQPVLFGEALDIFTRNQLAVLPENHGYLEWRAFAPEYHQAMTQSMAECGIHWQGLSQSMQYDLSWRINRSHNRRRFMEQVVRISQDIQFFGTGGWLNTPAFAPYFKGYQGDVDEVRTIFQYSRINLHDGIPSHFRFFDCLGSGGFLFFRQPLQTYIDEISEIIRPDEHFIIVNDDNMGEKAAYWLPREEERREMARRAAMEVHNHHTWKHRVANILADLAEL